MVFRSCRSHTHCTPAGDAVEFAFPQLVGNADLAEGRLLNGKRNDGTFDLLRHTIFQHWFLTADLLQCEFAAFVVKLLEATKAVAANPALTLSSDSP